MKFKDIFDSTVNLWPQAINISDGRHIEETKGFYSHALSEAWNKAEDKAANEWQRLMVWTIYQALHRKAVNLFEKGIHELIVSRQINETEIEKSYFESLKGEGYEQMLKQYSN